MWKGAFKCTFAQSIYDLPPLFTLVRFWTPPPPLSKTRKIDEEWFYRNYQFHITSKLR